MSAAVLRANALRLPLADESVDLVVSSPPYWQLRSYRDDDAHYSGQLGSEPTRQSFLEALWAVMAEVWRVLKPTGSAWLNLGDKYCEKTLLGLPWRFALGCIDGEAAPDGQRWILRAEVIWSKPNGLPESVTDRVRRSHEQLFHLVKSPRYFSAVDEVREAHADRRDLNGATDRAEYQWNRDESGTARQWEPRGERVYNALGKLPGSVWTIPSEPLIIPEAVQRHYDLPDHFAAFPQELPRRIILGWSPNGVCVECGEGRRPVVVKDKVASPRPSAVTQMTKAHGPDGREGARDAETATIRGYRCGCHMVARGYEDRVGIPATTPAVVLDPFGGTGTTAMVARTLGRFGVGVDLSADYNRLAKWRIWSSGHGEKAAQQTWRENQGDLFGNAPVVHCEDVEVGEVL